MRTLISALAVVTLSAVGCRQTSDGDAPPSAQKQVQQVQEESAAAYDRAKEAQQNAAEEAREAAKAQDQLADKRQELAEAEAKAAQSQREAEAAQESARVQGEAAHAEVQQLQGRAAALQTRAIQDSQAAARKSPLDRDVEVRVESVEPVTPNTIDHDSNVDARVEVERLQAQIDQAFHRVRYGE